MPNPDPRLTQITIIIMLLGAFTLRAMGIGGFTEWLVVAIALGHLGLNIRRPKGPSS